MTWSLACSRISSWWSLRHPWCNGVCSPVLPCVVAETRVLLSTRGGTEESELCRDTELRTARAVQEQIQSRRLMGRGTGQVDVGPLDRFPVATATGLPSVGVFGYDVRSTR